MGQLSFGIVLSDIQQYKPDIKLWRDRAEEARTQAELMINAEARQTMLSIAEMYERMIKFYEDGQRSRSN